MSKVIVVKNVPAKKVKGMKDAAKKLLATDIKETDNGDGTSDLEVTFPN